MKIESYLTAFTNDLFAFAPIAQSSIPLNYSYQLSFKELQEINQMSRENLGDLNKISFACLAAVLENYVLLPVGSCIGAGEPPRLVANQPLKIQELPQKIVGVPGKDTSAYLALRLLAPSIQSELVMQSDQLWLELERKTIDCALVIHSSEEEIKTRGLQVIADLGITWQHLTSTALPLGGLVARRSLGQEKISKICADLRLSLTHSLFNRTAMYAYVQHVTPNKSFEQLSKDVSAFINAETLNIEPAGIDAIEKVLSCSKKGSEFLASKKPWLFTDEREDL